MEDTVHIFWKNIDTLMRHMEQLEKYQQTGKIVAFSPSAVSGDIVRFGGLRWIVLCVDNDENKALLTTGRLLSMRPMAFSDEANDMSWENSKIREYLNNAFLNRFDEIDREKILETTHSTPMTPWFDTPGGNDTTDKAFLLSLDDLVRYLGDSGQLLKKGWPREGAVDHSKPCVISDEYDNLRCVKDEFGEFAPYWLRSMGRDGGYAAIVKSNGVVDMAGVPVDTPLGVRPAMWVRL